MNPDSPIGVFDSGLGGLTVAREIIRQMPDERMVYFGDTARVPYGSKSKTTIIHYTEQILAFLKTKQVKAIVVACNTASALALEEVQSEVDVPIIGVVKPGAKAAAEATRNGKIGVIGTEATIGTGLYGSFIKGIKPGAEVFQKACPMFVPLVEEGWWHDEITTMIAERYTRDLRKEGIDTLIMGCTHYPLLRSTLKKVMGPDIQLVNPAYETAVELRRILEWKNLAREESAEREGKAVCMNHSCREGSSEEVNSSGYEAPEDRKYSFYVSDDPDRFYRFARSVLNFAVPRAEQISIEEY